MMTGFFNNVASLSLCAYVRGRVYVCVLGGVCLPNLYFKMRGIIHLKHQGLLMEHRQEYTDTKFSKQECCDNFYKSSSLSATSSFIITFCTHFYEPKKKKKLSKKARPVFQCLMGFKYIASIHSSILVAPRLPQKTLCNLVSTENTTPPNDNTLPCLYFIIIYFSPLE